MRGGIFNWRLFIKATSLCKKNLSSFFNGYDIYPKKRLYQSTLGIILVDLVSVFLFIQFLF